MVNIGKKKSKCKKLAKIVNLIVKVAASDKCRSKYC